MARIKKAIGEVDGKQQPCLVLSGGTKYFNPTEDLEERLFSAYAEKFECGTVSGQSWLGQFVNQQMDTLKQNLKKDPNLALSTTREVNKIVRDVQNFYNSKKAVDIEFTEYQLYKKLFPWQQAVMRDQSKRKCLICSRRCGKSYMESFEMIKHCLKGYDEIMVGDQLIKKARCAVYVGLTIGRAADIMWDNLKKLIEECRIPVAHIDNSTYRIDFSNGAFLKLCGNSNTAERNKIRGDDWSLAIVDECQNQQSLAYLYDSILNPIVSARRGTMIFSGTGPLVRGYWSDIIDGSETGWTIHHYGLFDNPTIENPEQILAEELAKLGGDTNNPTYKREWLGEICWSDDLLIYPKVTNYEDIPKDFTPTSFWGGIDYGFRDYTAILGFIADDFGQCYLISEWKKNESDVTTVFNQAKAMLDTVKATYKLPDEAIHLVADTNEQMVSQELYNRGILQIENAYKSNEKQQIAVLNEALASGRLKVKGDSEIAYEATMDSYKYDEEHQRVIYEEDSKVFHADALDALRYAYFNYYQNLLLAA